MCGWDRAASAWHHGVCSESYSVSGSRSAWSESCSAWPLQISPKYMYEVLSSLFMGRKLIFLFICKTKNCRYAVYWFTCLMPKKASVDRAKLRSQELSPCLGCGPWGLRCCPATCCLPGSCQWEQSPWNPRHGGMGRRCPDEHLALRTKCASPIAHFFSPLRNISLLCWTTVSSVSCWRTSWLLQFWNDS